MKRTRKTRKTYGRGDWQKLVDYGHRRMRERSLFDAGRTIDAGRITDGSSAVEVSLSDRIIPGLLDVVAKVTTGRNRR
jgi:hypothetical protein